LSLQVGATDEVFVGIPCRLTRHVERPSSACGDRLGEAVLEAPKHRGWIDCFLLHPPALGLIAFVARPLHPAAALFLWPRVLEEHVVAMGRVAHDGRKTDRVPREPLGPQLNLVWAPNSVE